MTWMSAYVRRFEGYEYYLLTQRLPGRPRTSFTLNVSRIHIRNFATVVPSFFFFNLGKMLC